MKRFKRLLSTLIIITMVIMMLPVTTQAETSAYSTYEVAKLSEFLELPSAIPGYTNGQKLCRSYKKNNPSTWDGIIWTRTLPMQVEAIDWSSGFLTGALDVSDFTELKSLFCPGNRITSIKLTGDLKLWGLWCAGNLISDINLDNLNITDLYIENNKLNSLDVSKLGTLSILDCSSTGLTSLDISNNRGLFNLFCADNNLTELSTASCPALNKIICSGNKLTSLDFRTNNNLYYICCDNNELEKLYLPENREAYDTIDCSNNQLKALDTSSISGTCSLYCNNNYIEALDLSKIYDMRINCLSNCLKYIDCRFDGKRIILDTEGEGYVGLRNSLVNKYQLCEIVAQPVKDYFLSDWMNGINSESSEQTYILPNNYSINEFHLTARFLPISETNFKVIFDLAGGIRIGGGAAEQFVDGGRAAIPPIVIREGYEFAGWSGDYSRITENSSYTALWKLIEIPEPSITPEPTISIEPTISPEPTITPIPTNTPAPTPVLIKPITYTVIFDPNGGTWVGGSNLIQEVSDHGTAYPPIVEYPGHRFVGWDKEYQKVDVNLSVTAIWEDEPVPLHTVFFDVNGGIRTGGGAALQKIGDAGAANAPSVRRDGYTFDGWDTTFDHVIADLTVTAQWKEAEPVTPGKPDTEAKKGTETGANMATEADTSTDADTKVSTDSETGAVRVEVTSTSGTEQETDLPKTGKSSGILLGGIMLLCGSGIVVTEIIRRRRQKGKISD